MNMREYNLFLRACDKNLKKINENSSQLDQNYSDNVLCYYFSKTEK